MQTFTKLIPRKLFVFPGTFDPPHRGHLNVAKNVLRAHPDASFSFLPVCRPWSKPLATEFGLRTSMVWEMILDGFLAPPYTDNPVHRRASVSVSLADWTCRETTPTDAPSSAIHYMDVVAKRKDFFSSIALVLGEDAYLALDQWEGAAELKRNFEIVEVPRCGMSSTALRKHSELLQTGVTPRVLAYIRRHNLYQPLFAPGSAGLKKTTLFSKDEIDRLERETFLPWGV